MRLSTLLLLFSQLFVHICSGELILLLAIWRHGDRAPGKHPYPNDIYGEGSWPRGWNQLTNKGIQQTYELGKWFRQRYIEQKKFLKPKFSSDEVFVRSSDTERAIESGQAVMAGMYPATGVFEWAESENISAWQPIPIHTNGAHKYDTLLKPTSVSCEAYSTLMIQEHGLLEEIHTSNFKELFEILSLKTGMIVNYRNVKSLYDITREMGNGLPPPDWARERWRGKTLLEHIIDLKRITRLSEFNSNEKSRYRAGILINDWLEKLQQAGEDPTKKTYLYSSHDGTLTSLMYSMGISNDQLVPYAATVICELQIHRGDYYVQLLYKNGTEELHEMALPGCESLCPLEQFANILGPTRIRNEEERRHICAQHSAARSFSTFYYVAILLLIKI